jgi:hypothetical protein
MVTIGFFNLVACNSDDAVVVVSNLRWALTAGANFSKYVALGNY